MLWFLAHTAVIVGDGLTDEIVPSDVAVVLGSKVEPSGVPSERLRERLDRALELYDEGSVRYVLVSGGLGKEGHEEADVMAAYLHEHGVPRDRLLKDRDGWTTFDTARNARRIMRAHGFSSVVVVTSYYHVSRTKLAFARFGVDHVSSASARFNPGWREPWSLAREWVGYYYYAVREVRTGK